MIYDENSSVGDTKSSKINTRSACITIAYQRHKGRPYRPHEIGPIRLEKENRRFGHLTNQSGDRNKIPALFFTYISQPQLIRLLAAKRHRYAIDTIRLKNVERNGGERKKSITNDAGMHHASTFSCRCPFSTPFTKKKAATSYCNRG